MFAGKAGAYFRVDHLKKVLHMGRIQPYPQTLYYAGKACQGKHSSLLQKFVIYGQKKFCNIGPKGLYRKTLTRAYFQFLFQFLYHRPYSYKA
jgi:hypothetical protein